MESLISSQHQREKTQSRLADLRQQTAQLSRLFPWPGLGDRRQAVEQAQSLLYQTSTLAPGLSALRTRAMDMFQLTQDPYWTELSWAEMEECIPALLKDLTVSFRSQRASQVRWCSCVVLCGSMVLANVVLFHCVLF